MVLKTLLAGTALLAATGDALASKTYSSKATCSIKSISSASSQSKNVVAVAVREINAALCGDSSDPKHLALGAAKASARIFAEAIADVTIDCVAKGNAEYKVNGKSMAYAQATGIAKAFAKAEGSVGNCDTQCSAAGKVIASSFDKIFLDATAKLEPYFYGKATDEDSVVRDKYELYTRAYEEATVEAFALVIVKAKGEVEKCASSTFAIAGAGEKDNLNIASCKLDLTASTDEYIVDSVAKAYADAGAHTCFGRVTSEYYEVEAKAIAEAMAIAVTGVSADCFIDGDNAYACAMGKADITKTATAVAKSFAKGWAEASSKCFGKCEIDFSASTKAIGEVLATSYSDIYFNQCTKKDRIDADYTKTVVVKAAAPAIAKIIARASASLFGRCQAVVVPTSKIGETTTTTHTIHDGVYTKPTYPAKPTHPVKPTQPVKKTEAPKRHTPRRKTPKGKALRRKTPKGKAIKRRHNPKNRTPKHGRRGKAGRKGKAGRRGVRKGPKRARKIVKKFSAGSRSFFGRTFFRGKAVSKTIPRKN